MPAGAFAQTIYLKTGGSIQGKIVEKTDEYVKVDFLGVLLTYHSDEIKEIKDTEEDETPVRVAPRAPSEQISEEETRGMINKLTVAYTSKDVEALKNLFWENAQFLLIDAGKKQEFTTDDYLDVIKDTFDQASLRYGYQYTIQNVKSDGSKSICYGKIEQVMGTQDGQTTTIQMSSQDIFEKRNGLIKEAYQETTILPEEPPPASPQP